MRIKKRIIGALCIMGIFSVNNEARGQNIFRNPLDIPIQLSANFGEIRTDHFHTGYDIRTNGKTGYRVYAAAEGYISRIKVSPYGFGRVIYITHPNGYMTVYGHLDRFNDAISKSVKEQQYANQSFEVELFPDALKFPVKKGDFIALSGNSGSSGGPHLHFEIRDASGESYPLNPAKFFPLTDHMPPKFRGMFLYPLTKCCELQQAFGYSVTGSGKTYKLKIDTVVTDYSTVGLGAEVVDFMDDSSFDYGIYSLQTFVDDKEIFSMVLDRLVFANGRYANAQIDYKYEKQDEITIQRTFKLPGDHNTIYQALVNNGQIDLTDNKYHQVKIVAKDAAGNSSELSFVLKCTVTNYLDPSPPHDQQAFFKFSEPNTFASEGFKLELTADVLYDDLYFYYSALPVTDKSYCSSIYQVHNPYTPLHSSYKIYIKPGNIPLALKPKAVIVYEDQNGKRSSKTSQWEGEYLTAKPREFGSFYVRIDTTAPKISTSVQQNQLITSGKINFMVSDDLSGIVSYKGLLDGNWILMEYDPKNNLLSCIVDEHVSTAEHLLKVIVSDDVKNESTYTLKFKR